MLVTDKFRVCPEHIGLLLPAAIALNPGFTTTLTVEVVEPQPGVETTTV
jgi:hypothetical protein